MWETSPSVRDAAGPEAYAARQVLDPETREAITDVNLAFLTQIDLLLPTPGAGGQRPTPILRELQGASAATRAAAAACPYTLFNLRFEDAVFWRGVRAETRPALAAAPVAAAFGRAAVVLAWHLVRSREFAAPIALGMAPAVSDIWRELPVRALDRVACMALPHLKPRWPEHPRFWPMLLAAAADAHPDQLAEVRLLGLQLLAADAMRSAAPAARARR